MFGDLTTKVDPSGTITNPVIVMLVFLVNRSVGVFVGVLKTVIRPVHLAFIRFFGGSNCRKKNGRCGPFGG